MVRSDRDAAFRWPVILPGDMEEDGTALALDRRIHVAIQDDDDVVQPVITPHFLVTGLKRQIHQTIVAGMARIIAPAEFRLQNFKWKNRLRRSAFVSAIVDMQELECSCWGRSVPFPLACDDAGTAQRTRNRDRSAS